MVSFCQSLYTVAYALYAGYVYVIYNKRRKKILVFSLNKKAYQSQSNVYI